MSVDQQINPPCVACGTETRVCSDHSGGWLECPSCGAIQNLRLTPNGPQGRWTFLGKAVSDELGRLHQWKREAMQVIADWEQCWHAAGEPGRLGESKAAATREWIEAHR